MRHRHKDAEIAALAWQAACDDARLLAVELAAGRPYRPIDIMQLGLVIEPGETAFRYVAAALSQFDSNTGLWPYPTQVGVLITDQRLLVRLPHGAAISLWWTSVLALDVNLQAGHVLLDFGDGEPRAISGAASTSVAVSAVALVYGVDGLLAHRSLDSLRAVHMDRRHGWCR